MRKKLTLICLIIIIMVGIYQVTPTFAIFSNDYTTDKDIVGLDLNFDVNISNIEEYEELKIEANSYEIYNINIANETIDNIYYGIWYKMVAPKEKNDDITIARLEDNRTPMTGSIAFNEEKLSSIIIKNNTTNDIIINIGIASSEESAENIEYLGGKHLITGSENEVDYYYEEANKRYISSIDNNTYFTTNDLQYEDPSKEHIFENSEKRVFKVEAWGASKDNNKGSYTSGTIKLEKNDKLYLLVGKKDTDNYQTEIRLISEATDSDLSKKSSIMVSATTKEKSYISGHLGLIATDLDEKLKSICQTGLEDIACSYHSSKKHFKNTQIIEDGTTMPILDNQNKQIDNEGNGYIKIKPVVPTIELTAKKVKQGKEFNIEDVTCNDNGSGCNVVKISPSDTSKLSKGTSTISIMVTDDYGLVYKYTEEIEITE